MFAVDLWRKREGRKTLEGREKETPSAPDQLQIKISRDHLTRRDSGPRDLQIQTGGRRSTRC